MDGKLVTLRKKGTAFSHLGEMALGSIVAQGIVFVSTLLVSRIYSPSQFGTYSLIIGMSAVIVPILTFCQENFIVPAPNNDVAIHLFKRTFRMILFNSSLLIFLVTVFGPTFFKKLSIDYLDSNISLIALLLGAINALYTILNQLSLRKLEYRKLAIRGPVQNFCIGIFQITSSNFVFKNFGLIIGEAMGRIAGILVLLPSAKGVWSNKNRVKNQYVNLKISSANFLSIIFELISINSALFFIVHLYSKDIVGQFAMAQKIISLPTVVIGTILSQYLLSIGSARAREGKFDSVSTFDKNLTKLFMGSVLLGALILIIGLVQPSKIMGDSWNLVGSILIYSIPGFIVSFVWNPISAIYYVYNRWNEFLVISSLRLLLVVSFGLILINTHPNIEIAVLAISFGNSIAQIIGIFLVRKIVEGNQNTVI